VGLAGFASCKTVYAIPELGIREPVVHQPDLHTLLQFFYTPVGREKLPCSRDARGGSGAAEEERRVRRDLQRRVRFFWQYGGS